mgnify:CR=1 FL=1
MFEKFSDYMYYLLISPLKRVKKELNQWYKLFKVLGKRFDDALEAINKEGEESMLVSCDDEFLQIHADERKMQRYAGENNSNYRKRIANYQEVMKLGGTDRGIKLAAKTLGYSRVEVIKANKFKGVNDRWAEFYVLAYINLAENSTRGLEILKKEVRKVKYVGAKDNYIFTYSVGVKEPSKIRLKVRLKWNMSYYIFRKYDGSFLFDGRHKLNSQRVYHNLKSTSRFRVLHKNRINKTKYIRNGEMEII